MDARTYISAQKAVFTITSTTGIKTQTLGTGRHLCLQRAHVGAARCLMLIGVRVRQS